VDWEKFQDIIGNAQPGDEVVLVTDYEEPPPQVDNDPDDEEFDFSGASGDEEPENKNVQPQLLHFLEVTSDGYQCRIPVLPNEQHEGNTFPVPSDFSADVTLEVNSSVFDALDHASKYVHPDKMKRWRDCVGIVFSEGKFTIVGTDSLIMGMASFTTQINPGYQVLIDAEDLRKFPGSGTLEIGEKSYRFTAEDIAVYGRLADDKMPDIQTFVQGIEGLAATDTVRIATAGSFIDMLTRVPVIGKNIMLHLDTDKAVSCFICYEDLSATGRYVLGNLPALEYEGNGNALLFQYRYIVEGLRFFNETESITMRFYDKGKHATLLISADNADKKVLMMSLQMAAGDKFPFRNTEGSGRGGIVFRHRQPATPQNEDNAETEDGTETDDI